MGNSSLLEWGLRFFKRALHLIVLACLQINDNYSHCVCIRNASNKLQLKEKQAMRVCLLHPCEFCKAEIRRL